MENLLARLSFSFIILALVCAWEGFQISQGHRGQVSSNREVFYYAAAIALFIIGLIGTRMRHR